MARLNAGQRLQHLRDERAEIRQLTVRCSEDHDGEPDPRKILLIWNSLVHGEQGAKSLGRRLTKKCAVLQRAPTHLTNAPSLVPGQLSGELPGQVLIEQYAHRRP